MGHLPHIPSTTSSLRTELLGSFLLVLIGTSALTALNIAGQATTASAILVGTAAFSAAIGWLTYIFYRFPLPQFNPAVTALFWTQGIQPLGRSFMIMVMQFLGAVTASVVVALLYGSAGVEVRLGAPYPATAMGDWAALVAEFMGTLIVLYAVQSAIKRQRLLFFNPFLLIALGYSLGYLLSTGISGGALNPARALAPQLAAADLTGWWVYLAGPMAAAVGLGLWSRRSTETSIEVAADVSPSSVAHHQIELQTEPESKPAEMEVEIEAEETPMPPTPEESTIQPMPEPELVEKDPQDEAEADEPDIAPRRPKLPFAITRPSFYPLSNPAKNDEPKNPAIPVAEPSQPIEPIAESDKQPEQPKPQPTVKFVNFEPQATEEDHE